MLWLAFGVFLAHSGVLGKGFDLGWIRTGQKCTGWDSNRRPFADSHVWVHFPYAHCASMGSSIPCDPGVARNGVPEGSNSGPLVHMVTPACYFARSQCLDTPGLLAPSFGVVFFPLCVKRPMGGCSGVGCLVMPAFSLSRSRASLGRYPDVGYLEDAPIQVLSGVRGLRGPHSFGFGRSAGRATGVVPGPQSGPGAASVVRVVFPRTVLATREELEVSASLAPSRSAQTGGATPWSHDGCDVGKEFGEGARLRLGVRAPGLTRGSPSVFSDSPGTAVQSIMAAGVASAPTLALGCMGEHARLGTPFAAGRNPAFGTGCVSLPVVHCPNILGPLGDVVLFDALLWFLVGWLGAAGCVLMGRRSRSLRAGVLSSGVVAWVRRFGPLAFTPQVGAVACAVCRGFVEGCTGTNCPWTITTAANAAAVATGAAAGALTLKSLLPPQWVSIFPRAALDTLLMMARAPAAGTPFQVEPATTIADLKMAYNQGRLSKPEVSRAVDSVIDNTPDDAASMAKLTAQLKTLEFALQQEPASPGENVGVFHYILARVTHFVLKTDAASVMKGVHDTATLAAAGGQHLASSVLFPVAAVADVVIPQVVHYFCVFVHAFGFEHLYAVATFVNRVLFDTVLKLGHSWCFAFELFLVYLKELDLRKAAGVTMESLWHSGSQDTFMVRARSEAVRRFGDSVGIFRTPGGKPGTSRMPEGPNKPGTPMLDKPGAAAGKVKWNGKDTPSSKRACFSYQYKGREHPPGSLLPDGTCKFAHVCDHFVVGHGDGARCGRKHGRWECDHPDRKQ